MLKSTQHHGRFITLEGIEGVGKSTHLKFIQQYLAAADIPHIITREPGGTPIAEAIRNVLLTRHEEIIMPEAELLLLFAGRAQHIAHVIQPALDAGKWVVCDRFTDTSYAYQGGGRGVDKNHIAALEKWIQGDLQPDPVLLFDAPVEIALRRIQGRKKLDRFEAEKEEFFQRARRAYLERARQFPQRYKVLDANMPITKVKHDIKTILDELVKQHA